MKKRLGFSLLEVILAMAILGIAVAILGEGLRQGLRAARTARDTTKAGLLCESKLNEVLAGIQDPSQTSGAFDNQTEAGEASWAWSIETEQVQQAGLLALRVTVRQDLPDKDHPIEVSLVRWIVDTASLPSTQAADDATTESSTPATGSSNSSSGASR